MEFGWQACFSTLGIVIPFLFLVVLWILVGKISLLLDLIRLVKLLVSIKLKALQIYRGAPDWSVADLFEECVDQHAENPAIIVADKVNSYTISYGQLEEQANRVYWWAKARGLKSGQVVALLMPACVDFVATWIGLAKLGVCSALINNTLPGKSLSHAVLLALDDGQNQAAVQKVLIVSASIWNQQIANTEVENSFRAENIDCVLIGGEAPGQAGLDADLCGRPTARPAAAAAAAGGARRGVKAGHTLFYVYTSGTTGLPKASRVHHFRFWMGGAVPRVLCRLTAADRLYCALPLHHAAGGVMGLSACFQTGATLVLRPKFSASSFAQDITTYKCTAMQYIGEMARYLSTAPPSAVDAKCGNSLRVAIGNGLRPDVWVKFQKRYKIKNIIEFYASTEGNTNIFNNTGKVGAIGVVPWFASFIYPIDLIRCDPGTREPVRGPDGLCRRCRPGHPGQVVGLIKQGDPMRHFDGYTDAVATSKKVLRDVFRKGDKYFLSGDLLEKDSFGFYYWVDRIGDTFRWKGENVSTSQVAGVLAQFPGVADAAVYGVEVPGCEGRAGMAALTLAPPPRAPAAAAAAAAAAANGKTMAGGVGAAAGGGLRWEELGAHLDYNLPKYAQPLFIRIMGQQQLTSTFKHRKNDLQKKGFMPLLTGSDEVYYRDDKSSNKFFVLTPQIYQDIVDMKMRF